MKHGLLLLTLLLTGCGGEGATEAQSPSEDPTAVEAPDEEAPDEATPDEEAAPRDPEVDPNLRIGHVMAEVGYRFQMAGRAGQSGRWELAAYQSHEILEMFDMDMRRALLPGDCDDDVADSMYEQLRSNQLADLRDAAVNEDGDAFAEHFATVSGSCNGCHGGCNVAFIQVPSEPGAEVPRVAADATSP